MSILPQTVDPAAGWPITPQTVDPAADWPQLPQTVDPAADWPRPTTTDPIAGRQYDRAMGIIERRRARVGLMAIALIVAACGVDVPPIGGPSQTVRSALDRMFAHDLVGAMALVCPAQRDPSALPLTIPGIFSPVGNVPMPAAPETLALIEFDASDVRVGDVAGTGTKVQVPVTGILRLRLDPAAVEAAVRATAAAQGEAVDELALRQALDAIAAGPTSLDLGREVEAVQVVKVGDGWFVCEPLPSPAPAL